MMALQKQGTPPDPCLGLGNLLVIFAAWRAGRGPVFENSRGPQNAEISMYALGILAHLLRMGAWNLNTMLKR